MGSGGRDSRGKEVEQKLLEHIRESHRRLRSLIEKLGNAQDPEGIRAALEPLPQLLFAHFNDEERPGGLFEGLREARPSIEPKLSILHAEHKKILTALKVLSEKLESGKATSQQAVEELKNAAASLITTLNEHERGESKLAAEAYYSDDGGSG
jgi:hemerythrin